MKLLSVVAAALELAAVIGLLLPPAAAGPAFGGQLLALPPSETAVASSSGFPAISCVSPTTCFVAGGSASLTKPVGAVAEVNHGKVSKAVLMAEPGSGLDAIACVNANLCLVAGQVVLTDETVTVTVGLLAVFSHDAFHDVVLYKSVASFTGVACRAPALCYAAGYVNDFKEGVLTEVFLSPSSLTATPGFVPVTSDMTAVACPSRSRCYAVGGWAGLQGIYQAAVLVVAPAVSSKPAATNLPYYGEDTAVACVSATSCTTVGNISSDQTNGTDQAYTEALSSLGAGTAKELSGVEYLYGIANLDAHHQVAVGDRPGGIGVIDVITDGASSTPLAAPGGLEAIACPVPTTCWAAGATQVGSRREGAIVRFGFKP
jgi:hypothetical protein